MARSSRIGVLEGVLVVTLILFSLFSFVFVSSLYMTAFYGLPSSAAGVTSSPDKSEVFFVLGTQVFVFSPTRVPPDVDAAAQERALSILQSVVPFAAPVSASGVVPFALSAVTPGDSVVDPYRERSVIYMSDEDDIVIFASSVSVPVGAFGFKQRFALSSSSSFVYSGYVFSKLAVGVDRVLFMVVGPSGSSVYFACMVGVPNLYYDVDTGVYLKAVVRGDSLCLWRRGSA